MPLLIEIAVSSRMAVEALEWRPFWLVPNRWGIYDLEVTALRIAFDQQHGDRLHDHEPYTPEGERAFRQYLSLLARYIDSGPADSGRRFDALLLHPADGVVTPADLLTDVDRLIEALSSERIGQDVGRLALELRNACVAAIALNAQLRFSFVAGWRPDDAPIYEYTAGVEGFSVVNAARLEPNAEVVVVWLASGYVYEMSFASILNADGVSDGTHILNIAVVNDGAAMRVCYDDGVESDWTGGRVLSLCEPLYFTFDERRGSYRLRDTSTIRKDCRRVIRC